MIKIIFAILLILVNTNIKAKEISSIRLLCKYNYTSTHMNSSWDKPVKKYIEDMTSIYILKESIFYEENGIFYKDHYDTYEDKKGSYSRYGHLYVNNQRIYASDGGKDFYLNSDESKEKSHSFENIIKIDRVTGKFINKGKRTYEWNDSHKSEEEIFSYGACELAKNKF